MSPTWSIFLSDWRKALSALYDIEEADNLFFWACEELFQWNKPRVVMLKHQQIEEEYRLALEPVLARLTTGEPVQYIFRKAYFLEFSLKVTPEVLIPRPETEELVKWVLEENAHKKEPVILDLGTGSGCIAIACSRMLPGSKVFALDVSPEALSIARENASANKASVEFIQADMLTSLPAEIPLADIIISNPPYVSKEEADGMRKNVLDFEPHIALFAPDDDVLIFYRALLHHAQFKLKQGCSLYAEINENKADDLLLLCKKHPALQAILKRDLRGKSRFLKVTRLI